MQVTLLKSKKSKIVALIVGFACLACAALIPILYQVLSVRLGYVSLPLNAAMAELRPEYETKLTNADIPFTFLPVTDSEDGEVLSLRVPYRDAHAAQVIIGLVARVHEDAVS